MRVMLEEHRVAEVVQKQEGPSAKNLDLRTFWKSLGQKQCFLGKRCTITCGNYIEHVQLK